MNSVNQMVSDLKNRMNDGSETRLVKKSEKKGKNNFPWFILLLVLLSVGVGALTSINYFEMFDANQDTAQIQRQNIKRDPVTSVVIKTISDDQKINVVKKITPVSGEIAEKKVVTADVESSADEKIEEKPPVKKEIALAKKEEQKSAKPEPVVTARVEAPKQDSKSVVTKKVEKEAPIKPTEAPVKLAKVEKKNAEIKDDAPVIKKKSTTVAKVEESKSKLIKEQKIVKKPKVPVEAKPKVPPKQDVAQAVNTSDINKDAFNKTPIPLTNSELAETIYQRGITLLEQGEVERATALFVKTLKEYPPHLKATEALVGVYSNQQNWGKAVETLKSGIDANKKNVSLTMWLAQIYLQQGRMPDALDLLKNNEKHAKGNGEYFALLAVIYQNLEQYDLALSSYQKALNVDNSSSRWWFGMAVVLELQNNLADAQVAYTQALNTGQLPDDLVTYAEQRLEYVVSQN